MNLNTIKQFAHLRKQESGFSGTRSMLLQGCALILVCSVLFSAPAQADATSAQALKEMTSKDWAAARSLTIRSRNPVLAKMYEWMLYQSNATGLPFENIARFIQTNPHWPDQDDMKATAERNMPGDYPARSALQWFDTYSPETARGLDLYVTAAISAGQKEKARQVMNTYWPKIAMKSEEQSALYSRYGSLLSTDSKRRRLDYLLFREQNKDAKALAKTMGSGYVTLTEARIELRKDSRSVEAVIALVPASLRNDPGFLYERLKWRRKKDEDVGAIQILNNPPPTNMITNNEDWWKERNIMARRLIEEKRFAEAYKLAANHQQMEGQEYADAEWLAGWLALRFLNKPEVALHHFESMYPRVKTAMSRARASYWAGMAAEKLGRPQETMKWMQIAASFPKVYYGQLAARHMKGRINETSPVPAVASAADIAKIQNSDLGRAIRLTHEANLKYIRNKMIIALTETLETGGEYKALAQMLTKMGLKAEALKIAKKASGDNFFLREEAYPTLRNLFQGMKVDVALAHALIRQESQFDPEIKSPAGAMGLMQVMPGTAKEVAKKRGWQHQNEWMTTRPQQNVLIGSAYLNDVIARFGGSYPLALAAYNAGPRNVSEWLQEFGDPRRGDVDWVDWIELIPIYETRNYVQRVMENYIVYKEHMGL